MTRFVKVAMAGGDGIYTVVGKPEEREFDPWHYPAGEPGRISFEADHQSNPIEVPFWGGWPIGWYVAIDDLGGAFNKWSVLKEAERLMIR